MIARHKLFPFVLTFMVILADQITKSFIAANVPINGIFCSFFGDLVRIVHVRNTAVAFSLGYAMPHAFKLVFFGFVPLLVLVSIACYQIRTDSLSAFRRWILCGIVGGGFGNLIDRLFRPLGVVDFVDVKFFGIFGLDRWPTFNVADVAIVACCLLLVLSYSFSTDGKDN